MRPIYPELVKTFRNYLVQTLLNFQHHLNQPDKAAFMRLVLTKLSATLILHNISMIQGPKQIQLAIATALETAHQKGLLVCEHPLFSAQFYFGILRNLEWKILMGLPNEETDQENINYINYCVDRFLDGHQKS